MSVREWTRLAACQWAVIILAASCSSSGAGGGGGQPSGDTDTGAATSGKAGTGAGPSNGEGATSGHGGRSGALDFGDNPDPITSFPASAGASGAPIEALGCRNLQCQQHECATGTTTISGKVYDPAGKNPLYNVAVFIPNAPLDPMPEGASCECEKLYSGKPVVSTLTNAAGEFKLEKAPDGADIPLVIQIGKWRRSFTIPSVAMCADTPVPDRMLRLPSNRTQGDLPNIAISTGTADTLECLLRRVGVDATEYGGGGTGANRIHIFQGAPGNTGTLRDSPNTNPPGPLSAAVPGGLWTSKDDLMKYDILLLSCEGAEAKGMNQQAVHDYASAGGRVFASHFHYSWFNTGPYAAENLATWTTGSQSMGNIGAKILTDFPKGVALHDWLAKNNALVNDELQIEEARHNADVTMQHTVSQPWIIANEKAKNPGATQYFSFNTPTDTMIGPDGKDYCGRVVYSDLHVGAASNDQPMMPVPASCSDVDLSPQEKALEFMLFDLSACVIPDDRPPVPPPILQ